MLGIVLWCCLLILKEPRFVVSTKVPMASKRISSADCESFFLLTPAYSEMAFTSLLEVFLVFKLYVY